MRTAATKPGTIAEISFGAGRLVMPAETPYERELALEHAEHSARRHGSARLELGTSVWVIRIDPEGRSLVWGRSCRANGPRLHLRLAVPA